MAGMDALTIKLFADGADLDGIKALAENPAIKGFTTNPTLMRKAGVSDYKAFALDVLDVVGGKPVSFEVFADTFPEMIAQARVIASWGDNVSVKIPVTNTKGESAADAVRTLSAEGVTLNVTAMFTMEQVDEILDALHSDAPAILSVFAGRIADTGVDPVAHMRAVKQAMSVRPNAELLWASPREALNIIHAQEAGADIITCTPDLLAKAASFGKNLAVFSLETVEMFYRDASAAGYEIPTE